MVYKETSTTDYDPSRYEVREYTVLPVMYLPNAKADWCGLQTFIQVKSIRKNQKKDDIEESYRYY